MARPDFTQGEINVLDREGKQVEQNTGVIDFSGATLDEETGRMCVIKEEEIQSLVKEPILECTHKNVEKCHYTYVTEFAPSQEEICTETFQKVCQITFKQQPQNETIKKCYNPLQSVCNGQGKDICKTIYESSCSTRYIEKQPGKFVGDTKCEKQPIEICGAGCVVEEGPEECHDKHITTMIDIPEEICDLNPQKTCRLMTKLVPKLTPKHECTIIPQEICNLKFTNPSLQKKPLLTKWCLDDSPVVPDETYEETNALGDVISGNDFEDTTGGGKPGPASSSFPDYAEEDVALYGERPSGAPQGGDNTAAGTANFPVTLGDDIFSPGLPNSIPSGQFDNQFSNNQDQGIPTYGSRRRRYRRRRF